MLYNQTKYIDVILPLPLADYFTYRLPEDSENNLEIGSRIVVPFGKKKFYTAIVARIHEESPSYQTKEIISVLDKEPIVTQKQLELWKWIASYYQCTLGEVYKAALPSGLKLESDTAGVCKQSYKAKTEAYVRLSETYSDNDNLNRMLDELSAAPKQMQVLMKYLDLSNYFSSEKAEEISKSELSKKTNVSESVITGLVEKGVLEIYRKEISRLQDYSDRIAGINPLNEAQQNAYEEIVRLFEEKDIVLLHGVTSSGKTEVYIRLIDETIKKGKQVLYLLPEIALTTQITERMTKAFGNDLCVYHSKFSDNERVEIWNNLLHNKECKIILGVRSSVFLPFTDLGLIIVDEEHENTYKQQDPAPRYHAKNTAMILVSQFGAKTLLGTATPSVESYFHAKTGRYGLVKMDKRFEDMKMPEIEIVDTKILYKRKQMQSHFSPLLLQKISDALAENEQVILFQNRRGFAPTIECKLCAWIPKCKNCDVSLTFHKYFNQLVCHYCGHVADVPVLCPVCGNPSLAALGFGTEKIEEEISALFPGANVARMDLDTARSRTSYEKIIADFAAGKTNILIGTQMISKGLDFDNVRVVGILSADNMINFPDFRSHERAFQLMAQVSGRAGRKNKRGTVVIQTGNPTHSVIRQVKENDYEEMFGEQLAERKLFRYPPFTRLMYVFIKHKDPDVAGKAAAATAAALRSIFGKRVLGPDKPIVARIQTFHIQKIVLKIETEASQEKVRAYLNSIRMQILQKDDFKSVIIYYDVDPM